MAHLADILLLIPHFLADPQHLGVLLEKIAITVPLVIGKIVDLLHVRVAALASARGSRIRRLLPKYRQVFASPPLHVDERQREILLVDGEEHVEPFRAEH